MVHQTTQNPWFLTKCHRQWPTKIIQKRWFSNKSIDFRDSKTLMVQAFSSQNMLNRGVLSNQGVFKTCFQTCFQNVLSNRGVVWAKSGCFQTCFQTCFQESGCLKVKSGCFQTCFQTCFQESGCSQRKKGTPNIFKNPNGTSVFLSKRAFKTCFQDVLSKHAFKMCFQNVLSRRRLLVFG